MRESVYNSSRGRNARFTALGFRLPPRPLLSAPLLLLVLIASCQQRVVRYNSFLTGLPGAEQKLPANRTMGDYKDPTLVQEEHLVTKDAKTKQTTLMARTGRHLMIHIYNCVDSGDADLFVDQVLSTATRAEFAAKGIDPREGSNFLVDHQPDLQKLFTQIPAAEYTPGLYLKPQGDGVQRVELDGMAARGHFWTGFDMVQERGNWKLRWMVGPEKYE